MNWPAKGASCHSEEKQRGCYLMSYEFLILVLGQCSPLLMDGREGRMEGSGGEFIATSDNTESNGVCRQTCHSALSELGLISSVLQCHTVSVGSHVSIPT